MSFEPLADPFGLRADPDRYVPRPATERALDELERGVLLSDRPVVLFGPPGIGKTLLLRVLGRRLATSFRSAYLPYPLLKPGEICRWALMELEEVHTGDPEAALLEAARRTGEQDLGVLLLIDDADALPLRTAERLFEMFHQCQGDLRIVMAAADSPRSTAVGVPSRAPNGTSSPNGFVRNPTSKLSSMSGGTVNLLRSLNGRSRQSACSMSNSLSSSGVGSMYQSRKAPPRSSRI